jgi:hypothetical protein
MRLLRINNFLTFVQFIMTGAWSSAWQAGQAQSMAFKHLILKHEAAHSDAITIGGEWRVLSQAQKCGLMATKPPGIMVIFARCQADKARA